MQQGPDSKLPSAVHLLIPSGNWRRANRASRAKRGERGERGVACREAPERLRKQGGHVAPTHVFLGWNARTKAILVKNEREYSTRALFKPSGASKCKHRAAPVLKLLC